MYCGYVTTIQELRKHGNADRLQVTTLFMNSVIVGMDYTVGQRVVFFPVDGQLSEEFCRDNDLVRRKDEHGMPAGGYLDPVKRNIKAIRLRGEKSEGLALPIESLENYCDVDTLRDGDQITMLNGHEICRKYIPRHNQSAHVDKVSKTRSNRERDAEQFPFFSQHIDTQQLAYNRSAFVPGDICYITLKCHGTSARTANTIEVSERKKSLLDRLLRRPQRFDRAYKSVSGTRRTVLRSYDGGYYGDNAFRQKYHDLFSERLPKGMEAFYEICGWVDGTTPIMGKCKNRLTGDKEFVRKYGDETVFSYGCEPGENRCFVYRMTMTNEDGYVVELPWHQVKVECEKMGVEHVPEFDCFIYTTWEDLMERVERFYDGEDPIGKSHVREGVVVRIDNRPSFTAYKHKNYNFKCLEGIIKDNADAPDMEEAEELIDEGV